MFAAILLIPLLTSVITPIQTSDEQALMQYRAAVSAYTQVRHDSVAMLTRAAPCARTDHLQLAREELGNKIRLARVNAREGDIFNQRIANLFRGRLERALIDSEMEPDDVLSWEPDHPTAPPLALEVNGLFPLEVGPPRWRVLFWALPLLPEELEYRLVGADLLLLDVDARIVVDILRGAIR